MQGALDIRMNVLCRTAKYVHSDTLTARAGQGQGQGQGQEQEQEQGQEQGQEQVKR
jgi:hypothetical protein